MNKKPTDGEQLASFETEDKSEKSERSEVEFEDTLPLKEAVAYVEAIVTGLKQGSINMNCGDRNLTLSPASHVDVEVKAVRKRKREGISLELSWRVTQRELTISPQ
jgi:amphi-Trp domain-containing protein